MTKSSTFHVLLLLDQYAGNVDELVCSALTNRACGRHGEVDGRLMYREKVLPHITEDLQDFEWSNEPVDEYGLMPYALGDDNTNSLKLFFDGYSADDIDAFIDIWKLAYLEDGVIQLKYMTLSNKECVVKILRVDVVEVVSTKNIRRAWEPRFGHSS